MKKYTIFILLVILGSHANGFAEVNPEEALSAHNAVRSTVNNGGYAGQPTPNPSLPLMMWDQTLADEARAYAEQCIWAHSSDRINVGENLYATTNLNGNITAAVDSWASEHQYYMFQSDTCTPGEQCGHYTQLVWFDSILVGCGEAICDSLQYPNGGDVFGSRPALNVVCRYATAGNLYGNPPYQIDGGNRADVPIFDSNSLALNVPYTLLWYPDNLVIPYSLKLSLVDGLPVRLKLDSILPENYGDMAHIPVVDVNTLRLYLPLVEFMINGAISQHSLVLEYVPGTASPLLFELVNAQ